jgi:ubiquinone/menaquinone biosynthesis C-methylase UbiE
MHKDIGINFFKDSTYDKVRSEYTQEVSEFIKKRFAQHRQFFSAVEVGAGTGKFTEAILKAEIPIKEFYVVEPDANGLKKHKVKFEKKTKVPLIYKNSYSSNTELNESCADIIFCGHCFHWFDFYETRIEFLRILKKSGQVFILGRFLDEDDYVSSKYIKLTRFGKRKGFSNNIEAYAPERINDFYGHSVEKYIICKEAVPYKFSEMWGKIRVRIASSGESWVNKLFLRIEKFFELTILFTRYRTQGKLLLKYTTFAFCSGMTG